MSLAHALRQSGAHVEFLTRALGSDTEARIQAEGFPVHVLRAPTEPFHEGAPPLADRAGVGWQQDADETPSHVRRMPLRVIHHGVVAALVESALGRAAIAAASPA